MKGHDVFIDLQEAYNPFKHLYSTHEPDDIMKDARCEAYHEERKDISKKLLGATKSKHLADIVMRKIEQYNIMSAQQWENRVPPDIKLQLIKEFGLAVDSYIQKIIRISKTQRTCVISFSRRTLIHGVS